MQDPVINQLLIEIKKNKKYKSIADEIILNEINNYLKKNRIRKVSKPDIKQIRNQLHKSYASFQTRKKNKIKDYLNELKNNPNNKEIAKNLLSITISTKERLINYSEIYKKIFKITGKPKKIIDLGCGLNPFSFPLMNLRGLNYYAYDIDKQDINYLNEYFDIMNKQGLNGIAEILDINNKDKIKQLQNYDIAFLFKIIDLLDKDNHKPSEELIKTLINKTKFIVASFATKTLTRKSMNNPHRKWFELMIDRINLKFQTFKTDNEIFYVINKK